MTMIGGVQQLPGVLFKMRQRHNSDDGCDNQQHILYRDRGCSDIARRPRIRPVVRRRTSCCCCTTTTTTTTTVGNTTGSCTSCTKRCCTIVAIVIWFVVICIWMITVTVMVPQLAKISDTSVRNIASSFNIGTVVGRTPPVSLRNPNIPLSVPIDSYVQPNISQRHINIQPPIKIAHVISLIHCYKASRVKGFLDALIVLRHSIHQTSVHAVRDPSRTYINNNTLSTTQTRVHNRISQRRSKYSYQMHAIVHPDGGCTKHIPLLQRLGYIVLVRSTPVNISQITTNEWYKHHVGQENCCGDAEFVKLYAYTLTDYPIVVHWDLDVIALQPMDDLYDSMLYDKNTQQGNEARQRLQVEVRSRKTNTNLPDRIDAFFTRDVTSSQPWEPIQPVQGGFVVTRPNLQHFVWYQQLIQQANYSHIPLRGPGSGWGGLGYGGFQGAMAYQGVVAYFYDHIYPGRAVELDYCRWNQVVADVIYRGPERKEYIGQCRKYPAYGVNFVDNTPAQGQCEDCRILPVHETMTVHYTACKKPWECTIPYPRVPKARMKEHKYRLQELTNITTCGLLFREYFNLRLDIESRIATALGEAHVPPQGDFHPDYFCGYCQGSGRYISMKELPIDFTMQTVYGF